jgi:hypothetical protein
MSYTQGPWAGQAQRILRANEENRPPNTDKAYDGKLEEFKSFCDMQYQNDGYPRLITEAKLFIFLYYHAYRQARKRGKRKRSEPQVPKFNKADFILVTNAYKSDIMGEGGAPTVAEVESKRQNTGMNLVGFDVVNQYFCSIMREYQKQIDNDSNRLMKEQLVSSRVKALIGLVKNRKARVKKANYLEKIDHKMSPYRVVQKLTAIEARLFEKGSLTNFNGMAGLRNRFTFLVTLNGVLRGESIFKCELSDMCDFYYHARREPDPYHIAVMMIATGKVNQNKTLFGRFMRHKDVTMCAMGGLGLYFLLRFSLTKEYEHYDFTDNKKWFDVKLMVDSQADWHSVTTAVSDQNYAKEMRKVCKDAGVDSKHFVHFGRVAAPIGLEMEEVDSTQIKLLGNWCPDTQDERYSAKMPLKAMRVAQGFDSDRGSHYNPRTRVEPPVECKCQVFAFVEECEAKLDAFMASGGGTRETARAFLEFLKNLRSVVLQDAALLIASGRKHAVFELPVFKSNVFLKFQSDIVSHIADAEQNDPRDASIERVLPGVQNKFAVLQSTVDGGFTSTRAQVQGLEQKVDKALTEDTFLRFISHVGDFNNSGLASPLATVTETVAPANVMPWAQDQRASHINVAANVSSYTPQRSFTSVSEIYNICHGINIEGGPPGGMFQLEISTKKKWRTGWESNLQKRFSRMQFIVKAVDELKEAKSCSIDTALATMDVLFRTRGGASLSNFEKFLKKEVNSNWGDDVISFVQLGIMPVRDV